MLLRDDKSLPYILLTGDHEAPQLVKHRGARKRKGDYYGPFASVWAVNRTINALQRAFLLRSCNDSYYENRTRPCLLFQIKRCSGPCTQEIPLDEYAGLADQARAFLSGKSNAVKARITEEMQTASEALEFERAARCRDRLAALSAIQGVQGINTQSVEEADVFAIDEQAGQFCVEVFFFRNWQNWGNRAYFPKADKSHEPRGSPDVVSGTVLRRQAGPPVVLLSHEIEDAELMAAALSTRAERRVEIHTAPARRAAPAHRVCAAQRPARRWAAGSPTRPRSRSFSSRSGRPSARPKRRAASRSTTTRHIMGTNAVGAHDRRRGERLHEAALPHLQHEVRGPEARRRLRHDARNAASPLRPAGQGGAAMRAEAADGGRGDGSAPALPAPAGRRQLPGLARSRPDRRRPGQLQAARQALAEIGSATATWR